ncbi:PhaM family polyhydroxyalkanoate granule multifunctional regulatory protein [Roseateles chitosanitabidus]|uniref:PhaM family polyhydroxyalkanoate granule multifunctional regulatory protein n=1 Tax=Roseateles chitosanitabidus TaxID=65048 RepID=UPI000A90AE31|nr:PhaM family polyhydroxyalkanoate granule multifunctional regulatory protein [Roseateles chitosanitabidus]
MADTDFTRFVPGFDFLQGLVKNAGAAIPGFNQWVAPTLNPQELDKRIDELRTVQFWLEQNARMLAATIQALEVQRMTLSTLHAMNVPMADLKEVLKTAMPQPPEASPPPAPWHAERTAERAKAAEDPHPHPLPQAGEGATPGPGSESGSAWGKAAGGTSDKAASDASGKTPGQASAAEAGGTSDGAKPAGADPMQWWNALTQQFTQVAANAMKTAQTAAAATSAATAAATAHAAPPKPAARTAAKTSSGAAPKAAGKSTGATRSGGSPGSTGSTGGARAKPAAKATGAKTTSTRKPAAPRKSS